MRGPPVTYTYRLVHVVMNSDDEAAVAEEHLFEQFIGNFSDDKGFFSDWPIAKAAARCTEFLQDKTHLLVALMEIRQWKTTTLIGNVLFFSARNTCSASAGTTQIPRGRRRIPRICPRHAGEKDGGA